MHMKSKQKLKIKKFEAFTCDHCEKFFVASALLKQHKSFEHMHDTNFSLIEYFKFQ